MLSPLQVILDSVLPTILNMQLDVAPTTQTPVFKLLITFSEPVSWLANATTNSPASTPPTEDPTALAGKGGTRPTTYTSSRLLLTNAALLNISMVSGTAAVLANGDVTNAATGFVMWFRSWSGARAVVEVLGAAYQDIAGNRGEQDTSLEVRTSLEPVLVSKYWPRPRAHVQPVAACHSAMSILSQREHHVMYALS